MTDEETPGQTQDAVGDDTLAGDTVGETNSEDPGGVTPPDSDGESAEAAEAAEADKNAVDDDSNTVPENYTDFEMPEGVELDKAMLESATPLFKELGLTQENAQKLVDFQAKQMSGIVSAQKESFSQLIETWKTDAKNDSEIGGEAFEENAATAQQAIETFGDTELKQLMDDYGVGNHPAMIRAFVKIGKLLKEDSPTGLSSGGHGAQLTRSQQMYPK